MTHSIAISVKQPFRVANTLRDIWQGRIEPISLLPNSYKVVAPDHSGIAVEIFPNDTEFVLSENEQTIEFFYDMLACRFTGTYDAIPVPTTQAQIELIAQQQGWKVGSRSRGLTKGVELWVENQILLVLCPKAIAPIPAQFALQLCQPHVGV